MADKELEDLLNEEESEETPDELDEEEKGERSEKSQRRYKQLLRERQLIAKERDEKEKRIQELEFSNSFKDQLSKYPLAKDHEAEIKEHTSKGISVEDATILVLTKQKKLVSPEEIKQQKAKESSLGGSADISHISPEQKTSKEMTQAERLQALKDAEAKGDISLG